MDDPIRAAAAMHLLRRQRHSFLNHFQVIMGWLQLDRPDRARQYLDAVAARMARESDALKQAPPHVGLMMLEVGLEAETHGVQVLWQMEAPWDELPAGTVAAVKEAALERLAASVGGAPFSRIEVRVGRDGFVVHTPPEEGER